MNLRGIVDELDELDDFFAEQIERLRLPDPLADIIAMIDDEDDDELDPDSLALLVAMDDFTPSQRAWDPDKHPRGPGGRFITVLDRVKNALQAWSDGGDGDPFDGFDRDQLRKVAKARGLTIRRGATRDEIADALKADLLSKAKPAKKSPAAKSLMSQLTPEQRAVARQSGLPEDHPLAQIAERLEGGYAGTGPDRELLKDLHPDDVKQVGRELGLKFPPKMPPSEYVDHILKSIGSYDEPADVPDPQQAARDRQAKIDAAKGVAGVLAELDELRGNDATPAVVEKRLRSSGRRNGVPDETVSELVDAYKSGDRDRIDAAHDQVAQAAGLKRVTGPAGAIEPFDRRKHQSADNVRDGQMVAIIRPAYEGDIDGETVRLGKADVEVATAEEIAQQQPAAPKKAPANAGQAGTPDFDARVKAARKGNAATAAVQYKFTGNEQANADLFPDLIERRDVNDAFRGYKGIGYRQINRALRDGELPPKRALLMDRAFARSSLKADVVVYRGTGGTYEFGPAESWPADLTGATWVDAAYVSTSPRLVHAHRGAVRMRIVAPAGSPAVSLRAPTRFDEPESEILLGRGLRFRVVADRGVDDGGARQLDVEVADGGTDVEVATPEEIAQAAPKAPKKVAPPAPARVRERLLQLPKEGRRDYLASLGLTKSQAAALAKALGARQSRISADDNLDSIVKHFENA